MIDMEMDYEKRLEREVQAALENLPELRAPASLMRRVLAAIELRSRLPWFRRAWPTWPATLRAAALAILLVGFAGLCAGGWQLANAGSATLAPELHRVGALASAASAVFAALKGAVLAIGHQLGTGFVVGCLTAICLCYGLCVWLGAACVRFAFN